MAEDKGYSSIFKSTFLFGFVQAFNIVVKVILNKVAAITLGSQGIGLIGLYTSAIGMLKTGTGLGISQSAVRDISAANAADNSNLFSKTIVTTRKIILLTALLGVCVTVILSPLLSKWTFGNDNYIYAFIVISLAVAFTTLWEGQLAILKGMRRLRMLAKANMIGATAGLIVAVPLYYFYGMRGIIPVLIIAPLFALLFSNYYVRKIKYAHIGLSYKQVFSNASPMIKMGIALSFTTFLSQIATFAICAFIRNENGLQMLGFYNAGVMIMVGYFSVVINALTTDYYPRIAAVNSDNKKVQIELNKQSIVSLLICFPLIVVFLFLQPIIIKLLYSTEFYPVIDFVKIGILGTLITICSNQVDLILVAKNNTKIYTIIATCYRLLELTSNILFYKYFGLLGLGISMALMGVTHMSIMTFTVNKLYAIRFESLFIKAGLLVLAFVIISSTLSMLDNGFIKYGMGVAIFIFSLFFSYYFAKRHLHFDIVNIIKRKV